MKSSIKTLRRVVPFVKEYVHTRDGKWQGEEENAVYAVLHEGGLNRINYHYCYGMLRDYHTYRTSNTFMGNAKVTDTNPLAIFLQVQSKPDDLEEEAFRHFIEWMMNYSPYRNAFISKNVSKVLKDGVVVLDVECQSDTLGGAATAFRQAWENYYKNYKAGRYLKTKIWWGLSQKVDPSVAFAVSNSLLSIVDGDKVVFNTQSSGHSPFDKENKTLINFFRNNNRDKTRSWSKTYQYGIDGLSNIWSSPYAGKADIHTIVKYGLASIGGGVKKVNPFAEEQVIRYEFDEAIDAVSSAINNNKDILYDL